jgi:hypothetical protein
MNIYDIRTRIRKMWISFLDICIIFTIRIHTVIAVIIRYPQIGNWPIFNASKNNFDRFLVFWVCFENICNTKNM